MSMKTAINSNVVGITVDYQGVSRLFRGWCLQLGQRI